MFTKTDGNGWKNKEIRFFTRMLNFTSALYLGMSHSSSALHPWEQFTTGVPAALKTSSKYIRIAQALALLIGCEQATLGPSTLHLFWDLFGMLSNEAIIIYVDAGIYPIARWGVERAVARGVRMRSFPHHDADALICLLKRDARCKIRPLVVTDGWCPHCGKFAPITSYLYYLRRFGGLLIMDDTQALGIFGHTPGSDAPYGTGGGGSLRWHNIKAPDVLLIDSLAKGFGVPIATLAGSKAIVRRFEILSETRTHCSPPSIPAVYAAAHALSLNHSHGEALRMRLAQLVRYFVNRLAEIGLKTTGGLYPVQTLEPLAEMDAKVFYKQLHRFGIRTLLLRSHSRSHKRRETRISFIISARHTPRDIDYAMEVISNLWIPARNPLRNQSVAYKRTGAHTGSRLQTIPVNIYKT